MSGMDANNDNQPAPPAARMCRIIGTVRDERVTFTDPAWRADPRPAPQLHLVAGDAPVVD